MKVETESLRQEMLALAGETLVFSSETILGYPGFSTARLYDGETSLYHVDKKEFNFIVSTADAAKLAIRKNDTFTYSDDVYVYTFKLEADPIPDLTGFSKLHVIFTGRADV